MARAYNSDQCCTTCLLPSNEFHHAGIYHHQCHAKSVVRDASNSVALWRHLHAGFSVRLQPCHFGSALSKVVGKSLALYTVSVTHSKKRGSRWDVYGALRARLYLLSLVLHFDDPTALNHVVWYVLPHCFFRPAENITSRTMGVSRQIVEPQVSLLTRR